MSMERCDIDGFIAKEYRPRIPGQKNPTPEALLLARKLDQRIAELEAERDKWEWVARHEWRCPLGEMNPGEPGSHIVERGVSGTLLDRWQPR